ncbi:MAG: DivIVA domain-containing protein [Actinomycetota bacterium]
MSESGSTRDFTVRPEGYDRAEVDNYLRVLRAELQEQRHALETMTTEQARVDARLHDPEGAVTRTLAIAQETADRVLHDAQIEADRRRAEAEEAAAATMADADARAAKMMADIETQTAEVRAQGIAAARTAIQVERDKAVAELGQIRRARDDIRAEAIELQSILERYARQSNEASEILAGAASGPLLTVSLPVFVADDVALAGVLTTDEMPEDDDEVAGSDDDTGDHDEIITSAVAPIESDDVDAWLDGEEDEDDGGDVAEGSMVDGGLESVPPVVDDVVWGHAGDDEDEAGDESGDGLGDASGDDEESDDEPLAEVISIDGDSMSASGDLFDLDDGADGPTDSPDDDLFGDATFEVDSPGDETFEGLPLDVVTETDAESAPSMGSGAFLAEVRAAADDDVAEPADEEPADDSDRFLSELRGVTDDADGAVEDDDAADRFFDID